MSSSQALDAATAFTANQENSIDFLYLDSKSNVTIGYGHLLDSAEALTGIAMVVDATGKPASKDEKQAAWKAVQALSPRGQNQNYRAQHFAGTGKVSLAKGEGVRLLNTDMAKFYLSLERKFKDFSRFPVPAQVALLDIIFNVGPTGFNHFLSLNHAISDGSVPDWLKAAARSHRKAPISDSRNDATKSLFNQAALIQPLPKKADKPSHHP